MLILPNNLSRLGVTGLNIDSFPAEQQIFRRRLNTALKGLRLVWCKFLDGPLPLFHIIEGDVILDDFFLCIVLVKHQLLIGLINLLLQLSDLGCELLAG